MRCSICDRIDVRCIPIPRVWECQENHEKRRFSAKVGTVFEYSPVGLDKWFAAIWMIANCKNGTSMNRFSVSMGAAKMITPVSLPCYHRFQDGASAMSD